MPTHLGVIVIMVITVSELPGNISKVPLTITQAFSRIEVVVSAIKYSRIFILKEVSLESNILRRIYEIEFYL